MLEGKYATLLSGRYVDQFIFPLSFNECLVNEQITDMIQLIKQKPKVLALFDNLLNYGCFPKTYLEDDVKLKRSILTGYYNTILLKDCIAANDIRDRRLMTQLAHYMVTNVSARYSYNNISETLDSN